MVPANFEVVWVGVAVVGTDAPNVVMIGVGVVMVGTDVGMSMVVCVGTVVGEVVTVVPSNVEVVGVGVVEVDVGTGVDMVVFVRGCGSSGPKGLVGAVLEMMVQVVPPEVVSPYIEAAGVGVVMVCVDPPTDMVVRVR